MCSHALIEEPYPTGHSEKSSLTLFHETPFWGSVVAQLVELVLIYILLAYNLRQSDTCTNAHIPMHACTHTGTRIISPPPKSAIKRKKNLTTRFSPLKQQCEIRRALDKVEY